MNASSKHCVFYLIKKKNGYRGARCPQNDRRTVTSWNLREHIRVRELAATHILEQMRRLRMLEEQQAWKREAGFDRIEIIDEMRAQHFRAGFDSKPLYSKLYNPKWPHTPEEHTLKMRVDVERLRREIVLSQPAPPPQVIHRRNGRYGVE